MIMLSLDYQSRAPINSGYKSRSAVPQKTQKGLGHVTGYLDGLPFFICTRNSFSVSIFEFSIESILCSLQVPYITSPCCYGVSQVGSNIADACQFQSFVAVNSRLVRSHLITYTERQVESLSTTTEITSVEGDRLSS